MAARAADQQDTTSTRQQGTEVRRVEATKTAVTADPVLSGLMSWGEG